MAMAYAPNDIHYASDNGIQLQSMTQIRNSGGHINQASYQESDPHDMYQSGNSGIGLGSSSAALCAPQSSEFVVVVNEEEVTPARTDPPKDFLPFSLCVMIICCFPIGYTACQSSMECRRAISMRNMAIADAKSQEAKGRAFLAVVTGITTWIVVAAFIVLGVLSSS